MSRMLKQALSTESFESEEEQFSAEGLLEADLALEEAASEINEASHSLEMIEYQQEELEFAGQTLESIAMSLESHLEQDEQGISRQTAEAFQHAVTAVTGDVLPNPISSLESFGGESEAYQATQMSLESLKETAQKIWDAIKKAATKALEAVKNFLTKLFTGVGQLKSKLDKLEKQHGKLKSDGAKASDKFEIPKAEKVAIDGKADAKVIEDGLKLVSGDFMSMIDEFTSLASDQYGYIQKMYKSPDEAGKVMGELEEYLGKYDKVFKKVEGESFPGGYKLVTEEGKNFAPSVKMDNGDAKTVGDSVSISVPDLSWIADQISAVKGLVDGIEKKKSNADKLTKARDSVLKEADGFASKAAKGKFSEAMDEAQYKKLIKAANADMVGTLTKFYSYAFNYAKAVAGVLSAALSQYGKSGSQESADVSTEGGEGNDDDTGEGEGDGEGNSGDGEEEEDED